MREDLPADTGNLVIARLLDLEAAQRRLLERARFALGVAEDVPVNRARRWLIDQLPQEKVTIMRLFDQITAIKSEAATVTRADLTPLHHRVEALLASANRLHAMLDAEPRAHRHGDQPGG